MNRRRLLASTAGAMLTAGTARAAGALPRRVPRGRLEYIQHFVLVDDCSTASLCTRPLVLEPVVREVHDRWDVCMRADGRVRAWLAGCANIHPRLAEGERLGARVLDLRQPLIRDYPMVYADVVFYPVAWGERLADWSTDDLRRVAFDVRGHGRAPLLVSRQT